MAINEDRLKELHSEPVRILKDTIQEKDRILESYQKEHGRLQLFFDEIKAFISPVEPVKVTYKDTISDSEYHAVIQISDTHMGSVQEPNEIEGFGEYNAAICESRSIDFINRVIKWIERKRKAYCINNLTIIVTGDLCSGDIHQELQVTNEFPVTIQVIRAADLLAKQIIMLSPYFSHINVEFIGADNHGRLTKKPQAKEEGMNSYNYLAGYITSVHVSRLSNVEFNLYPVYEKVIKAGTRQYLATHGHNLRGWMGIPWYDVERKQNREARARMQIILDAVGNELRMIREVGFHKFVFGHFHYPINTPHYKCSGSTQGTDAYDHKNARHADPSQSAWLIHPKLGEFDNIDFNLK